MNGADYNKIESIINSAVKKNMAILEVKQANIIEKIDNLSDDVSSLNRSIREIEKKAEVNAAEIKNIKDNRNALIAIMGIVMGVMTTLVNIIFRLIR